MVCGQSNAGKTKLCSGADRRVWNVGVQGIDGDTPPEVGWKGNPYYWLGKVRDDPGPWILEGTGCFRLLRAGLRDKGWEPDAIVFVEASHEPDEIPEAEFADDKARSRAVGRAAAAQTLWDGYVALRDKLASAVPIYAGTLKWLTSEGEI